MLQLKKIFLRPATFPSFLAVYPFENVKNHKLRTMSNLIPIVAIISVFGSVVLFVSILTNYSIKKKLIDKNMVNDDATRLFKNESGKQSSLKWGLIILFAGLGLVIIDSMNLDGEDAMAWGIEGICIAVGFLLYYFAAKKELDK